MSEEGQILPMKVKPRQGNLLTDVGFFCFYNVGHRQSVKEEAHAGNTAKEETNNHFDDNSPVHGQAKN